VGPGDNLSWFLFIPNKSEEEVKRRKFYGLLCILAGIAGIIGAVAVRFSGGQYPLWLQLAYASWVSIGFILIGVYFVRGEPG
jgi:hypothetical protein